MSLWQPSASIENLKYRAEIIAIIRQYFADSQVLEVSTPVLSRYGNTDPNIESFSVKGQGLNRGGYLHTSPEFFMKRLLAGGFGDCYQICPVFRQGELGANHNPEFMMLEWYRVAFSMHDLINDVLNLIDACADTTLDENTWTYQAVFQHYLGIDPLCVDHPDLLDLLDQKGLWRRSQGELDFNDCLDLLFSQCIATEFDSDTITVIYHYPSEQASLARLHPDDTSIAERFEVYWGSTELANGFCELSDATEQRQRFEKDNQQRLADQKQSVLKDELFLNALEQGAFPYCSGVALGVDRLMMKLLGESEINHVMSFSFDKV